MANKPITTPNVTMGKHGRLHEEEAAREKGITLGSPSQPRDDDFANAPIEKRFGPGTQQAVPDRQAERTFQSAAKHVERKPVAKPAKVYPDITQRMDALRSALSDKYPHNDVEVLPDGLKVAVPTGHIMIESEKVAACKDNVELRAYIDALPIL